jgi:hypothetical protein
MRLPITRSFRGLALCVGVLTGAVALAQAPAVVDKPQKAPNAPITEAEVNAAQEAWCYALVKIGEVHRQGGNYRAVASQLIDELYDYKEGTVFFKPTKTSIFRPTKEGALAYFIGGDDHFPDDKGFALEPWVKVRYDNSAAENGIQIHGDIAITMGNVYLTSSKGEEVTVDKTFVFRRGSDGKLRLCVHHSSLPYKPCPPPAPSASPR